MNLAQQFTERIEQLIKDRKPEVLAFEIAAFEFSRKIEDVTLNPLHYVFIDYSDCEFRNDNIYYNL